MEQLRWRFVVDQLYTVAVHVITESLTFFYYLLKLNKYLSSLVKETKKNSSSFISLSPSTPRAKAAFCNTHTLLQSLFTYPTNWLDIFPRKSLFSGKIPLSILINLFRSPRVQARIMHRNPSQIRAFAFRFSSHLLSSSFSFFFFNFRFQIQRIHTWRLQFFLQLFPPEPVEFSAFNLTPFRFFFLLLFFHLICFLKC